MKWKIIYQINLIKSLLHTQSLYPDNKQLKHNMYFIRNLSVDDTSELFDIITESNLKSVINLINFIDPFEEV